MTRLAYAVVVASLATSQLAVAERDVLEIVGEAAARSNAGDHVGAAGLYELAYRSSYDVGMLPILGFEYRRAGVPSGALDSFCAYLASTPQGPYAVFARQQVLALRAQLGLPKAPAADACADSAPVRIDFVIPKKAPPKRKTSRPAHA